MTRRPVTPIVDGHDGARNVVDLDAARRRLRPEQRLLARWEIEAFSAAIQLAEPRSRDYWQIWDYYLRAIGETS
jgi:hypothetical protein